MDLIVPKTLDQAMSLAEMLSKSTIVPQNYQGNSANCFVAIQQALTLKMSVYQAMLSIAVINGKPTIYGDALLALVRADKRCLGVEEDIEKVPNPDKQGEFREVVATCTVKREHHNKTVETITRYFRWSDAQRANLIGKSGPWKQYPERMLQMRARAFALRDSFPDVLAGMSVTEEVEDYSEENLEKIRPLQNITPQPQPAKTLSDKQQMAEKKAAGYNRNPQDIVSKVTEGNRDETINN